LAILFHADNIFSRAVVDSCIESVSDTKLDESPVTNTPAAVNENMIGFKLATVVKAIIAIFATDIAALNAFTANTTAPILKANSPQNFSFSANGLGSEYSKALKQVYDAYSIKEGLSTINGVNNSISGSTSGGGSQSKAITINITAPIVQIDSTHIDNKQYTAQQIGEIAAKELVNIMSQVAVQ
jgi:hypothetical protein